MIYKAFRAHPPMGMYATDESQVRRIIADAGGTVVYAARDGGYAGPGMVSFIFVATKAPVDGKG